MSLKIPDMHTHNSQELIRYISKIVGYKVTNKISCISISQQGTICSTTR